jgi:hypothetical protein
MSADVLNGSVASAACDLLNLFPGRGRHIAYRNGWCELKADPTAEEVAAHLEGRHTVGLFTGTADWANFAVIDVDLHVKDAVGDPREPTAGEVAAASFLPCLSLGALTSRTCFCLPAKRRVANQAFLDLRNQTFCMANPFGMEPVVVPSGIRRTGPLRCNGGGRLL